jgi:trehalose 6-phosphate synthase
MANSCPGKVNYVPVQFLYASIEPDELTALYTAADICFISSMRDGMNLVCSEYVACHSGKAIHSSPAVAASGSLVLSRFAGAADHMDGAFIVNPWNKEACAYALAYTLTMDASEACSRMEKLGSKVEHQTR